MTQQEDVLLYLQEEPTCGTSFLNWHIPRYAARIHELRGKGHQITSERCQIEYHHHLSAQTVYTLSNHSWLTEDVR